MAENVRKTGIDLVGDVPWGTHFCVLYHTKEDLLDILIPYFRAGLENNEYCMWVTSQPLESGDATAALRNAISNLDDYIRQGQIEIIDYAEWYTKSGRFEADEVLQGWVEKEDQAARSGLDGLRLTGNTFWLEKKDWKAFADYEATVNNVIGTHRMLAICTYSLDRCGAAEIMDVVANHQFALIRREGEWTSTESSDRKRAEEALRESEERYRALFEQMPVGLYRTTPDGDILDVNPALVQMLGCPDRESLLALNARDIFLNPKDRDRQRAILRQKDIVSDFEMRIRRYDGTPIWVRDTVRAVRDAEGRVVWYKGNLVDITKRKQAEGALRRSLDFNLALFEHCPIQTVVVDRDAKVVTYNLAKSNSGDRLPKVGDVMYRDYAAKHEIDMHAELRACMTSGKPKHFPERKYGNRFLTIDIAPFQDGAIITCHDITERKRAEDEAIRAKEQLLEQERHEKGRVQAELASLRDELVRKTQLAAIGQISANIAHELRNPLGVVRNAAYYLIHHYRKAEEPLREYLAIIEQEVSAADRIIGNLLERARPKDPAKLTSDFGRIVGKEFDLTGRTEGIRCRMLLNPDPFLVRADPDQLQQVVHNLLSNAISAIGGSGELVVEATHGDHWDTIMFCDTGPGVAPGVRESLFDPLITTKAKGTGLLTFA